MTVIPADKPDACWRRACARGAIIGLVLASHAALLIRVLMPAAPASARRLAVPHAAGILEVELLPSPPQPVHAATRVPDVTGPALTHRISPRPIKPHAAGPTAALQATLGPAPATTAPAFIAGGGFTQRLRDTQASPHTPKLPGGHHYLAADLEFVPVEQQSIEGKLHQVAGLLFGGFDPVCRNLRYELAKSRAQQIADGYTAGDLRRLQQAHHCG